MIDVNNPSNEDILKDFEEMFSQGQEDENEDNESENDPETQEDDDEGSEEGTEENQDDESGDDEGSEEGKVKDNSPSKQAQAFYTLRQQVKERDKILKSIGSVIGLDDNASSEELISAIQNILVQKEAKDQGVPVEYLQRLQALESQVQEAQSIKHEAKLKDDLTNLADEFELDGDALTEFVLELDKQGKNPLTNEGVDLKSEYLKLHWKGMLEDAKAQAIAVETARKDKVDKKASKTPPAKAGGDPSGVDEVKTIADLDAMLDASLNK